MELYYRLLGRRKFLLKAILITSLILLSSFIMVLLPQLVSPHILSKYLDGLSWGNIEVREEEDLIIDIELIGATSNPTFIDDFNQTVKTASEKVYGQYQPKSINLFAHRTAQYLNNSYGNQTPTPSFVFLFGVGKSFFETLKPLTENKSSFAEVILLTKQPNETFTSFNVSISGFNTTIQHDDVLSTAVLSNHFPYTSKLLLSHLTTWFGNDTITIAPAFLFQIDDLISLIDPHLEEWEKGYNLSGFICFEEEQQDKMAWTIDAETKMNRFENEVVKLIQENSPSTWFEFMNVNFSGDEFLISLTFSFVRGLQVTFWCIGAIMTCLTFAKIQVRNKERELKTLIAGQKWSKRIGNLLVESSLVGIGGASIALAIIYPITKLQVLFNIDLTMNKMTFLGIGLITLTSIIITFVVFLDFEFYLRKTLLRPEEEYRLFSRVPKYLYLISLLLVFLLVWLLNRNLISVAFFAGFVISAGVVAIIVSYLLRLIIWISNRINIYQRRKRKTPLSFFSGLQKLWKKQFFSKLLLISFLISIVSVVFLFANFSADAQKTEVLWVNGGEIEIKGKNVDTNIVDQEIEAIQEITKYVKVLRFRRFINKTDNYPMGLVGNTIKPVFDNYTGGILERIYAINSSAFYDYFESWNMRNWISQGQITELKNYTCFISQKFKSIGFERDDTLQLFNSSHPIQIKGFIDTIYLPGMGPFGEKYFSIIMDYQLLLQLVMFHENEYTNEYHLRCEEEHIETVVENLVPLLNSTKIDEINYMDTTITAGVRIVFLKPIIVASQLFIILWGAFFLYTNLDDKNQSTEAKNLGIIAMLGNHRKTLRNYKLFEGAVMVSVFLLIFGIIYGISSLFFPFFWGSETIKGILVSSDTWLNLTFLFVAYPLIILIQGSAEYFKYRTIDLSVIYRHPE